MVATANVRLARPAMYLATYDGKLDAASFFVNFLMAIFDSLDFGWPEYVDLSSTGPYLAMEAAGCALNEQPDQALPALFDITQDAQNLLLAHHPGLNFLRPVVWFSEYCLADLTVGDTAYRQAFLRGSPLAPPTFRPLRAGEQARMGFNFTLPADKFPDSGLTTARLEQVIGQYRTQDFARALPEGATRPRLQLHWQEQAPHFQSLRIRVEKDA